MWQFMSDSPLRKIQLTQEKFTLVDDEDYESLMQWKWYYNNGYAVRKIKGKQTFMHRVVSKTPRGMHTDHINGNTLDNRKKNLRSCKNSQNRMNQKKRVKPASSIYKGVTFHKAMNKWQSQIQIDGKSVYLGIYSTQGEAAIAYNIGAVKHHGEFARLNEVKS